MVELMVVVGVVVTVVEELNSDEVCFVALVLGTAAEVVPVDQAVAVRVVLLAVVPVVDGTVEVCGVPVVLETAVDVVPVASAVV